MAIGTAAGIARINRRTSREQSLGLGRAPVVLQRSQFGIGAVQIARFVEIANAIAAEVVVIRSNPTDSTINRLSDFASLSVSQVLGDQIGFLLDR
jgi:hypothetical protein